ncbi:MAG: hypothetical protein Q8R24_01300 [Legionellaceae bacterium]|nr:hypothetical protein [Legionellaceae bacterium]
MVEESKNVVPSPPAQPIHSGSPTKGILKKSNSIPPTQENTASPPDFFDSRNSSPGPRKIFQFAVDTKPPSELHTIPIRFEQSIKHFKIAISHSILMDIMSNPYTGTLAVVGLVLFIAGIIALGVVFGSPQTIAGVFGAALTIGSVKILGGFATGIGATIGVGLSFFKDPTHKRSPEPPKSASKRLNEILNAPTL